MQNGHTLLLLQAERALESAKAQVLAARSLGDVAHAAQYAAIPAPIRSVVRSMPMFRALQATSERRMEELAQKQLEHIKTLPKEERHEVLLKLKRTEWVHLRGEYARVFQRIEHKAFEIEQLER